MADLQYRENGPYVRLTCPEGDDAIDAYNQIASVYSGADIPVAAWPNVRRQLRAAGYSVGKFRPTKLTKAEEAELMAAVDKEMKNFRDNL